MNDRKMEAPREAEGEEPTNVVPFRRPATGGSGTGSGGMGPQQQWLSRLEVGSRFLAEGIGSPEATIDEYILMLKWPEACLLGKNVSGAGDVKWYSPERFSKRNRLILIIEVLNDNNKQIQSEPVAGDESPEKPD